MLYISVKTVSDSDKPTCNKELLRTFNLEGFPGENPKV